MKRTMIISVILFFLFIAPARMISATNNLQVRAQAAAPVVSLAQEEAAGSELQRHDLGHGRYVAIIPALAPEDTYNQQPYIDTYVYSIAPGTSYCTSTKLAVQYNTGEFGTEYQRAFIGFHLSSIPSEAIIDSATFYAYLYDAWGANPVNIELRRVTANWGCPLYWPGPKSVAAASRSVGLTAGWYTWDVTALVANYWKGKNFGQDPNYGFELRGPETGGAKYYHYRYFRSKNASNGRPFLVVQYHLPATDTPTPTRTPTATPTTTPTATPTPTATAYCPDPYEPNETFAAASLAGAGTYQAYICTPGDQDWFRIDLAPLQELRVILTDLPKNYSLELFDPFGVLVAGSHRDGMTSEEIRFTASAQGGAYRVRVRGVAGAFDPGSPYTLKFLPRPAPPAPTSTPTPTYTPIPSCGPDPYEPNDSSATAASITTGMEIHAYICPAMDSDYYRFSVSGPVEIHARLYDLPAAYELTLYDPSGWVVARGSGSGTSPRELTYLPTTTGDYLLRVGPGSPESWDEDHPYSLRVDLNDLPPITLFPVADTYVVEADPTSTHGDERQVIVGRDEFGQEQWGLFRFDLSDVPAVTIANATFMVSLYDVASGMYTLDLRRISGPWDEDTVNWDTKPWSVDTGISAPVGGITGYYYTWDVTDLVQDWLTGGVGNFGLELRPREGEFFSRSFRSREYAWGTFCLGCGSARTPRLIIHFTAESPGALGSIGGRIYHDANRDGRYNPGESGLSGVRVELFRDRVSLGEQTTAADGRYLFSDLAAGEYEVVVRESALPAEYELMDTGHRSVSLAPGEDRRGVDFGVAARPTPTPLPTSSIDLTAAGIEFVQVIQGGTLIEGKRTLARVYVGVTGTTDEVRGVTGRLYHGFDWIRPIAPADLLPSADPMNDPAIVADLNRTLNFLLPDSWTTAGRHDFLAWVNYNAPDRECPGCWNAGNQYSTWAHGVSPIFRAAEPLDVTMIEVTADGISPTASREETYRWLLKTYPINAINVYSDTMSVTGYNFADTSGDGCGTGWGSLLEDLDEIEIFSSAGGESSGMKYYGMVDQSVPHSYSGCGYRPGKAAAGIVTPGRDRGGVTMAHEIGHNLGRRHSPCGGAAGPDPAYPHPNAVIGVYGIDLENPSAPQYLDPNTTFDFMSYCAPRWMSDFTYAALRGAFAASAAGQQVTRMSEAAQQEYLVGSGYIVDGLVIMTRPFYRLTLPAGTSDEPGDGLYVLELQDASGTPLFTRRFNVIGDSIDPDEGSGYFRQIVPWQPGTARIVIKEGQTVLYVVHVSAHAPEVTLLSPNGGEVWPPYGEHEITWAGTDADGDPLRYTLLYSPDGGQTWKAVATNLTGERYLLDASRLAGSETALIRVVASDGVNTAQDESDGTFTVEGKPPEALIVFPAPGTAVQPGAPILLEGAGTDLEDGPITDDAHFVWSSNLEGELGVGRRLYFEDLLPGWHTITLRVMDSDGFVGEKSISLFVGYRLRLPLILRSGQ